MPSVYAHYRFGASLLATFPADVRKTIQRFRGLYDLGLHGPDIFYYSVPLIPSQKDYLGIKYHEQTGREFFTRVCRTVRLERSEALIAYLYGVLCHYCLDSILHESVKTIIQREQVKHMELETEFDRYLLEKDGKIPAYSHNLSKHLTVSAGEAETISRFYPPATAAAVRRNVAGMAFYTRVLSAGEGVGRTVLEKGMRLIPKEIQGVLMKKQPNTSCVALCPELMAAYEQAVEKFPDYLEQLREHMTYSARFSEEFDRQFG